MKRRKLTVFSISFIDCICCGLGVHILPKIRVNNELPTGLKYNRYLASALLSLDAGLSTSKRAHLTDRKIAALSLADSPLVEYLNTHNPYAEKTVPKRILDETSSQVRSLMFFDQFEEILSIDPIDADDKRNFFAGLAPLLSDYRTIAIFDIREEYVAGLEPYLVYFPERLSARFRLEMLGRTAAVEAISRTTGRFVFATHDHARH